MDGNYDDGELSVKITLEQVLFGIFIVFSSFFIVCTIYIICIFIDIYRSIRFRDYRLNELVDRTWEDIIESGDQVYNDVCVVCLRDYNNNNNNNSDNSSSSSSSLNNGSQLQLLHCGHAFHSECIVPWLEQYNRCPVCHVQVFAELKTFFERCHICCENSISGCIRNIIQNLRICIIICIMKFKRCSLHCVRSIGRIFRRIPRGDADANH